MLSRACDKQGLAACDAGPYAQAAGFLLLRGEHGECFYLPPDEGGRLMQIDLSDDMVVAQLFGSGAWEDVMEPLKVGSSAQGTRGAGAARKHTGWLYLL